MIETTPKTSTPQTSPQPHKTSAEMRLQLSLNKVDSFGRGCQTFFSPPKLPFFAPTWEATSKGLKVVCAVNALNAGTCLCKPKNYIYQTWVEKKNTGSPAGSALRSLVRSCAHANSWEAEAVAAGRRLGRSKPLAVPVTCRPG